MPSYHYIGRDAHGSDTAGVIEASDRKAALRRLGEKGIGIRSLAERHQGGGMRDEPSTRAEYAENHTPRRFGPHPVAAAFFENYRELLAGGLPPGDAVKLMSKRVSDPALKALCIGLWRDLSEGFPLAEALAKRPVLFDESVVRLVEAGEQSGRLEQVASRILEDYARREALRLRVISALGYPVFIATLAMLVLTLFVFWIMPKMEGMMLALGGEFPWSVKAVMALAGVAVKGAPLIIMTGICLQPWWRKRRETRQGRLAQDAILLRIPIAGTALIHAESARLADLLSTLLSSGLSATDALRLAEKPIANAALREKFGEVRRMVNDGAAFTTALRECALFESTDLDLVAVGENAGALPRAFAAIAERRRRALDAVLKRLVTVVTAFFLGGAIGLVFFCLLSIVTTILSVSQSIQPHR